MRSLPRVAARSVATFAVLLTGVLGCDASDSGASHVDPPEPPGEFLGSSLQRGLTPDATEDEFEELAQGNTGFACDLYQALKNQPGNLFYSPFSISIALAMTYAGANGDTETQMASTMHFTLPEDRLHNAFNAVDLALAGRGTGAQGSDDEGFRLNVVNATWGQRDYPFLDEYLDVLALNYGAGLRVLDFVLEPESSRTAINAWVEEETEEKIKDLIPQGAITPDTRLVLTNAVYFNAAWALPFEASSSLERTFHLVDGSSVSAAMMGHIARYPYADGGSYEAVELAYDGEELSMVVIVPDAGSFSDVEAGLNADFIETVVASLTPQDVDLALPKLEFESTLPLADKLSDGMPNAFDSGLSDFSGMDGGHRPDLHITDVLHKAFVAVNEKGTEAAAATAVVVGVESAPMFDVVLTVDRPFFFLIRDIETHTVLFLGRVMDPTQ